MARLPGFDPACCEQVYNVVRTIARRQAFRPSQVKKISQGTKRETQALVQRPQFGSSPTPPTSLRWGAATNQGRRWWRGVFERGGERHWAQVPERDRAREFGTSDGPRPNRQSQYWIGCSSQQSRWSKNVFILRILTVLHKATPLRERHVVVRPAMGMYSTIVCAIHRYCTVAAAELR